MFEVLFYVEFQKILDQNEKMMMYSNAVASVFATVIYPAFHNERASTTGTVPGTEQTSVSDCIECSAWWCGVIHRVLF
jgi:hypothetical protein